MSNPITIAVDAMGGENSPIKVIKGIDIHNSITKDIFYNIFGNKDLIEPLIRKTKLSKDQYTIIHTEKIIKDEDSPLSAAKRGKDTSMWLAIESVKNKKSDAIVSAGNTGALFVIAKLNLNMIEKIDKPALSALWPNKNGMNIVLDLGANIESKNMLQMFFDFSVRQLELSIREIGYGDASINKKMKDYVNLLFSIIDKIDNWENLEIKDKITIFKFYIERSNNYENFVDYFEKYRIFLSKNTFKNLSKDILNF